MKCLVIVSKGLEDVAALEIKELIGVSASLGEGFCILDVKSEKELCLLSYKCQSVDKVLLLLDNFKVSSLDDFKQVKNIDFSLTGTFRVSSVQIDNDLDEVESKVGEFIEGKVDLNNPDTIIFAYLVKDQCYIGIDFSGIDLQKRSYKLFGHKDSIRGTIAYGLVRLSGFKVGDVLVDPFCRSGLIPIEAVLYSLGLSVNYYNKDKLAFNKLFSFDFKDDVKDGKLEVYGYASEWLDLNNSKKNAKIASVHKNITFSKVDIEWLDTKFKEKSIDRIVTKVPEVNRVSDVKQIEKLYNEFLHQVEFVLKDGGVMVVCGSNLDLLKKVSSEYKLKLKEERKLSVGKGKLAVLVFSK
jgi:23S rRNA G2445 N2-methylase RlmL